jgi:hypothetical protein
VIKKKGIQGPHPVRTRSPQPNALISHIDSNPQSPGDDSGQEQEQNSLYGSSDDYEQAFDGDDESDHLSAPSESGGEELSPNEVRPNILISILASFSNLTDGSTVEEQPEGWCCPRSLLQHIALAYVQPRGSCASFKQNRDSKG